MNPVEPPAPDTIEILGLRLAARIGVPDEERAAAQHLLADIRIVPVRSFDRMPDAIGATVDYAAVAAFAQSLAASGERRLIESLADEIASGILARFAARAASVRIRKFILPDTECVAVTCERERNH